MSSDASRFTEAEVGLSSEEQPPSTAPAAYVAAMRRGSRLLEPSGSNRTHHLCLKLTFKEFEGGAQFKLTSDRPTDNDSDHGKGILLDWRNKLQLYKPERSSLPDYAMFGVLRATAVGGYMMHMLKCTQDELALYTGGRLELKIRFASLTELRFDSRYVDGRDRGPSWTIRLKYDASWRTIRASIASGFPSRGELCLCMQSPRDVVLLNAWIPRNGIDRVDPPEETSLRGDKLLEEMRPIKTGKLKVKHPVFWRSHHVALYLTGDPRRPAGCVLPPLSWNARNSPPVSPPATPRTLPAPSLPRAISLALTRHLPPMRPAHGGRNRRRSAHHLR